MPWTVPTNYTAPVDQLLTLGRPPLDWPDYRQKGLDAAAVPELIRLMEDPAWIAEDAEAPALYAPIHAWRALAQLGAAEAVEPMLRTARALESTEWGREWQMEELPEAFEMIGPPAIPMLGRELANQSESLWVRNSAAKGLALIATSIPDHADSCIRPLVDQMNRYQENPPDLNGFLIGYLLDLKRVETGDVIRDAYRAGLVDDSIVTWGNVRDEFGIERRQDDPSDEGYFARVRAAMRESLGLDRMMTQPFLPPPRLDRPDRDRLRAKRKAQRKARKQNRRR